MSTVGGSVGSACRRFLFRDVSWARYLGLEHWLEADRVRLTYDRGKLEIMSPSPRHEVLGSVLGRVVDIESDEWDYPTAAFGSTTYNREDLDRGLESDECYDLANTDRVFGKETIDLSIDPPPDLAIEVDSSSSSFDRMAIYEALGVPELWRFDVESLRLDALDEFQRYVERPESLHFPGRKAFDVGRFLTLGAPMDKTRFRRIFPAWVRENLPRPDRNGE